MAGIVKFETTPSKRSGLIVIRFGPKPLFPG